MLTLGKSRWDLLKGAYKTLTRDEVRARFGFGPHPFNRADLAQLAQEWNVRKTLAYSMHEIAKVLDEDQVEVSPPVEHPQMPTQPPPSLHFWQADLVPEMECFLRDVEEVRMGIIKNLAVLFERMGPECRKCHLDILSNVSSSWCFPYYFVHLH